MLTKVVSIEKQRLKETHMEFEMAGSSGLLTLIRTGFRNVMGSKGRNRMIKKLTKLVEEAKENGKRSVEIKVPDLEKLLESLKPLNGAQLTYFRPHTDLFGTPVLDFAIQCHETITADAIEGLQRNIDINNAKGRSDDSHRLLLQIQWNENRRDFGFFSSWQKTYLR
jgi:hypothetical protein